MVCCRGFLPIWYMLKQDPWTLLEQMYIYWIMISLHTWVVRLISKYLWLLALQHINSTLKAQLLLIWSSFSWTESPPTVTEGHDRVVCSPASCVSNRGRQHFELIWFELNRVTPHYHRGTWSGCVFPSQLCFKPRKTTLWVDLVWVEPSHPPLSPRDMIGLCVPQPVVFQTEEDNTLSWSGLSWTESPPIITEGHDRVVCSPVGCVSNRGRQHFELIWFELIWFGSRLTAALRLWWPKAYVCSRYAETFARGRESLVLESC
jgi:hypothetical protein